MSTPQEMREAFTLFDTEKSGKIPASSLGLLMRSLGGNPTQAQLKSIVSQENLSAPFGFEKFVELMQKHLKAEPVEAKLREAFKVLDRENRGFLSVKDLKHVLTSIGEKLESEEFDEWVKEIQLGSDGKITCDDFVTIMLAK